MQFSFDKAACQNTRRSLRKEWLLTNGLGDYSSSSIAYCNTRKYHGLLVAATPEGRAVLLSTMEESILGAGKEFFISTRQHPGKLYPEGYQYLENFRLDPWPIFVYRFGDIRLTREILLLKGVTRLVVRWKLERRGSSTQPLPAFTLRLKPLLAYRGIHRLTFANPDIQTAARLAPGGFGVNPYKGMPPIYFQVSGPHTFTPKPDWYHEVEYFQERERGFDDSEDLFQPGILEIPFPSLEDGAAVYLAVGTEELPEAGAKLAQIWEGDANMRLAEEGKSFGVIGQLQKEGERFCVESVSGLPEVIAGYHWFDAWGRDTLIALPGLAFYGGRTQFGLDVLGMVPGCMKNGLVPNIFGPDEGAHAYNSADAALWYAFAVQCYLKENPAGYDWVRENAWGALKEIISGYKSGPGMGIFVDQNGLLHAGDGSTQLTWMDAMAGGQPVTPRHGCPVELNALWYNTRAFVDELARKFGEPEWECGEGLRKFRQSFFEHFWVSRDGGYLGDVWRDGMLDQAVRPNQILAVSLPHPVLTEQYRRQVVDCVQSKLLTPYGLRTLSPDHPQYRGRYEGDSYSRDSAYHQGTVWPWLLGQYTDAVLRVTWDHVDAAAEKLLNRVTPLFTEHLADAGLGSLSEIFDASPPFRPNGTVAQAWSVAECLRMLIMLKRAAPGVYNAWERKVADLLARPSSGDNAGVCRVTMKIEDVADETAREKN